MEARICGFCGTQFSTLTKDERESDRFLPFAIAGLPLLALYLCTIGGWWWIAVIICVLAEIGAIGQKLELSEAKRGKLLAPTRVCPSCDDKSAEVNSPLGLQLIAKWSMPPRVAPDDIEALMSMVTRAGGVKSPAGRLLALKLLPPLDIDPQSANAALSAIPTANAMDERPGAVAAGAWSDNSPLIEQSSNT